jgi:hypothetical protein
MLPPREYWDSEQDPKLLGERAKFVLKLLLVVAVVAFLVIGLLILLSQVIEVPPLFGRDLLPGW